MLSVGRIFPDQHNTYAGTARQTVHYRGGQKMFYTARGHDPANQIYSFWLQVSFIIILLEVCDCTAFRMKKLRLDETFCMKHTYT